MTVYTGEVIISEIILELSQSPHQPELRGRSLWVSWWVTPTSLAPPPSPPATPGENAESCRLRLPDTPSWERTLDSRLRRWGVGFQMWSSCHRLSAVSRDAASEAELEDLRQFKTFSLNHHPSFLSWWNEYTTYIQGKEGQWQRGR